MGILLHCVFAISIAMVCSRDLKRFSSLENDVLYNPIVYGIKPKDDYPYNSYFFDEQLDKPNSYADVIDNPKAEYYSTKLESLEESTTNDYEEHDYPDYHDQQAIGNEPRGLANGHRLNLREDSTLEHSNCWWKCDKKTGVCGFCGEGKACCRNGWYDKGAKNSCVGTKAPCNRRHCCTPQANCWGPCNAKTGVCNFCGEGQACCRNGWYDKGAKNSCVGTKAPCNGRHCCTPQANCWGPCNGKTGVCNFCGEGQACCRNGWYDKGSKNSCVGTKAPCIGRHCCTPQANCWGPCNGKTGSCPQFCGKGQACCRKGWYDNGPNRECKEAAIPCKGYHCCSQISK